MAGNRTDIYRVIALALIGLAQACSPALAAGQNPLVGRWVIAPGQPSSCSIVAREFTNQTETTEVRAIGPYPASRSTGPVRYNLTDPKHIYVIGPTGITNAGRWEVIDFNHIRDTSFSDCIYQRSR